MSEVSLNGVTDSLTGESVNLTDFAAETGGAWPNGWYSAEIIEGYATPKGFQFTTADAPSQKGDSRNLRICARLTPSSGGDPRNMQESFNYRASDFSPERLAYIKEARVEYKDVKGAWPDRDVQRSSLAIAKIGQLQKALALDTLPLVDGGVVAGAFVGKSVDIRLSTDENGYNVFSAFAPTGTKVKKAA